MLRTDPSVLISAVRPGSCFDHVGGARASSRPRYPRSACGSHAPSAHRARDHSNDTHSTEWGEAIYDRRLPPEVTLNVVGMEWRAAYFYTTFSVTEQSAIAGAILDWNSALQATPNSLSKYPIHYDVAWNNDPTATVQIEIFNTPADLVAKCGVQSQGCVRGDN